MNIQPIAILTPCWDAVSNAFAKIGEEPIRRIDKDKLPMNDPASYVGSISSLYISPREALRHDDRVLHHSFASFLVETKVIDHIHDYGLHVYHKIDDFYIISGTIFQWVHAIVAMTRNPDTRDIALEFYSYFNACVFRECFHNYSKTSGVFKWDR